MTATGRPERVSKSGQRSGAGWWLVATYPELAGLFASAEMIEKVRAGELWTDDLLNVMPSSLLSVSIFTNNVVVARPLRREGRPRRRTPSPESSSDRRA